MGLFARGRHEGVTSYVRYGAKIAISPTLVEATTLQVEAISFKGRFEQLSGSRIQI